MMYLYDRFKYELNAPVRVCAIVTNTITSVQKTTSYG